MYNSTDTDKLNGSVERIIKSSVEAGILTQSDREWIEEKLEELRRFIEESELPTEAFWEQFQEKFFGFADSSIPEKDRKIPMNAANLCPEPTPLLEVANTLRLRYNQNVSQQQRMKEGVRVKQLEWAREQLAEGLGGIATNTIAMVRNASEANNAISRSFNSWNPSEQGMKDNVVLWSENHPTNRDAWKLRAKEQNLFEVREVTFDKNDTDIQILNKFINAIDSRTRFVSYSWISNSTGFRIPDTVRRGIWLYLNKKFPNCHIHVDGTMAWGACQVNLKDNPLCHSFASSAHKWFLGAKETGILWMDENKVKNFNPSIFAYDYTITIHQDWPDSALRFELLGQRDDVNLITLGITQEIWLKLQKSGRQPYNRIKELNQFLVDELMKLKNDPTFLNNNWDFVTPQDPNRRLGIIVINIENAFIANLQANLYDWLYDNKGIAGNGNNKTFRLCPHIYNTKGDINNAVAGIKEWLMQIFVEICPPPDFE